MTKEEILAAMTTAFSIKATPNGTSGCGRVYVVVSGDRSTINAVAAAAKKLNVIFQRRAHYGMSNALYIGYDNADGKALAKGEAVAASLSAAGLSAYMDAHDN